jgi:hypothetical protein
MESGSKEAWLPDVEDMVVECLAKMRTENYSGPHGLLAESELRQHLYWAGDKVGAVRCTDAAILWHAPARIELKPQEIRVLQELWYFQDPAATARFLDISMDTLYGYTSRIGHTLNVKGWPLAVRVAQWLGLVSRSLPD